MTINEALTWAVKKLEEFKIPDAKAEAEFLLTHLLKRKRHELYLNSSLPLTEAEEEAFLSFIERRSNREPAQYITGETEFRGHAFKVTRDTLIPRPETELLIDEAIEAAGSFKSKALTIIDLCTGSGCIAVSTAVELPDSIVYATDISKAALVIAEENAKRNGVEGRIMFIEGDLFWPLRDTDFKGAHIIVTNPPYVSEAEKESLAPEVKDFEPHAALFGGADGLAVIKRIITEAPDFLLPGGFLIMEIGWDQAEKVKGLLEADERYEGIKIRKDYGGVERIVVGRRKA
ncbi:MAG: protein-(glutamine-N5) methyltransferase, release factor-specific [Deltaproteobacteria bacterium GWB2_55_19]|nr:MAG: protein-(glutamine-N5) methyltransferase, release factor-specific [Deltaproteobacteria bacterium GWB2_55_19]HAO94336.1 peptide chain release factor N(5)-glutamine methyltransferase [Deltaproteobacteria bacterium]